MTNIGLILFYDGKEGKKGDLIKRILNVLRSFFSTKLSDDAVKKAELYDGFNVFTVRLPHKASELERPGRFKIRRLKKIIKRLCLDYSIEKCYFPHCAPDKLDIDFCVKDPFFGRFLYKALLVNILKLISEKKGKDIRELDVAIIHGNDYTFLHSYIKILSSILKFLTIITHEKESIENMTDNIFEETGLAVRVTDNLAGGMKDAEAVINLADLGDFDIPGKMKFNEPVVNYGSINTDKIKFTDIINSVDVILPGKFEEKLGKDVYKFYKRIELAEIILLNRLEIGTCTINNNLDYAVLEKLARQFERDGFGFIPVIS
ncbi:MAG TPA: hypothetical protein PLP24_07195 [Acetivibrio thermocellus]|nr:hypothetical protein [Acetivibrio thermocellus]